MKFFIVLIFKNLQKIQANSEMFYKLHIYKVWEFLLLLVKIWCMTFNYFLFTINTHICIFSTLQKNNLLIIKTCLLSFLCARYFCQVIDLYYLIWPNEILLNLRTREVKWLIQSHRPRFVCLPTVSSSWVTGFRVIDSLSWKKSCSCRIKEISYFWNTHSKDNPLGHVSHVRYHEISSYSMRKNMAWVFVGKGQCSPGVPCCQGWEGPSGEPSFDSSAGGLKSE